MPDRKPKPPRGQPPSGPKNHPHLYPAVKLNRDPLNHAAMKWLREAKEHAPAHCLHLLTLASWGLEKGVKGEWPERDRPAIEEQVGHLMRWGSADALAWLLENPRGPAKAEQRANLTQALVMARNPEQAASALLGEIYSHQRAENPALA